MAYKTVVHRASKLWPLAIPSDDGEEEWEPETRTIRDVTPAAVPRGCAAALDALADTM